MKLNNLFDSIANNNGLCIVDTCFLVKPGFLEDFYPQLIQYNVTHTNKVRLYLLPSCLVELTRIVGKRETDLEIVLSDKARRMCNLILENIGKKCNFAWYEKGMTASFGDSIIIGSAVNELIRRDVYVFTADRKLSRDLCRLKNLESVRMNGQLKVCGYDTNENFYMTDDPTYKAIQNGVAAFNTRSEGAGQFSA